MLFASKLKALPKLLLPALFGQSLSLQVLGACSPGYLVLGLLFSILQLWAIVLLNDWADREIDREKRLTQGSSVALPLSAWKTIPDGILSAPSVLLLGLGAAAIELVLAFAFAAERPLLPLLTAAALFFVLAYSFAPLRLNYRGGGELLEGFAVAIHWPQLQLYLQSAELSEAALLLQLPFFALALAMAAASSMSDEHSDRRGGKRSAAALFGSAALAARLPYGALLAAGLELGLALWLRQWTLLASASYLAWTYAVLTQLHPARRKTLLRQLTSLWLLLRILIALSTAALDL